MFLSRVSLVTLSFTWVSKALNIVGVVQGVLMSHCRSLLSALLFATGAILFLRERFSTRRLAHFIKIRCGGGVVRG